MSVGTIAALVILGTLASLLIIEWRRPARRFEEVRGWQLKCLLFAPMILGVAGATQWLLSGVAADLQLLPGRRLGLVGGTICGILVSELVVYWAHRLHHRVTFLWRWIHQLHHSAERVDVFGAAYFHPFEILEGAVVGFFLLYVVLGLPLDAVTLVGVWQAFNGLFQHGNMKTPTWLGYFIQRPEQHGLHHQRDVHGFNYANLPLWDLIFGTFRNPRAWEGVAGFYHGASQQTLRLLLGRDVSRAPRPALAAVHVDQP